MDSISARNGLSLLSDLDTTIYSVGISTGAVAEIQMAKALSSRSIVATTIDLKGMGFAKEQVAQAFLSDRIKVLLEDVSKPLPYANDSFDDKATLFL